MNERQLSGAQAIREALDICLEKDQNVYIMGLGVDDPKTIFGTTAGLAEKYGSKRVWEPPVSENGFTGIAIGTAVTGMRPVLIHQRIDFAILSLDQIINNAAKWYYMYGGAVPVPLTIRMIIGRGWGQGPQHSQNLHALFMQIPGLKVVMPFSPYDMKGLLISSIADNNPVIFIEHRWVHYLHGNVSEGDYSVPIGKAKTVREGKDVTVVSASYMVLECIKAANTLAKVGIEAEIIDLRTIKPFDKDHICDSVRKTGRLVVVDSGYATCGLASEIAATVSENSFHDLKAPIQRITAPDCPGPTSKELIQYYDPTINDIIKTVFELMGRKLEESILVKTDLPCDVPDHSFKGPF